MRELIEDVVTELLAYKSLRRKLLLRKILKILCYIAIPLMWVLAIVDFGNWTQYMTIVLLAWVVLKLEVEDDA